MKFSAVIALSIAALVSAQVPKGTGATGGAAGGQLPAGVKCASTCLAPLKDAGCKLDGLIPKGAAGAGGMANKPPGGLGKPAAAPGGMAGMNMVRRQGQSTSPPKISPETIAAAKAARDCFCAAPAMKSAQTCINTSCASAEDKGAAAVKGINAICKGVASFTALTPAAGAAPPA